MKKNSKYIICGIIVALSVIVVILAINKKTAPNREISKALDLGNRYLSEFNYEEAVIAFNRVIEIDPMNVDAYVGVADAYIGLTNQNKPEDAMVKSAKNEMTSDIDPYNVSDGSEEKSKIESFYAPALKYCDDALSILNFGYELTHDESIKAKIDELAELQFAITKMRDDMINAVMSELDAARTTDSDIAAANVGDVVTFGTYNAQPAEWDVLDKRDEKALLISHYVFDDYGLAGHSYDQEGTDYDSVHDTNWEISEVRLWLNTEFITQLFNARQISIIQETALSNPSSKEFYSVYWPRWQPRLWKENTRPCGDTVDKLFLISWEEFLKYYGPLEYGDPKAWGSDHFYAPNAKCENPYGYERMWWLRSIGIDGGCVMFIDHDGGVRSSYVSSGIPGVRPAMWVNY